MDNKKIAELVNLALENDQNAFTKLYELTYKSVYTTISLKADDAGDIESILQDTYIKAFKKLNTLKNPECFCGWIKVIALNTARNFNKSHKKQIYLEDLTDDQGELNIVCDDNGAVPENVIDEKETVRLIKEMVQGLKDNQQLAITLFYYEKMSVKEIAQVMHCSENTVLSRLRLGREKLHAKIEELEKKGWIALSRLKGPFDPDQPQISILQRQQGEIPGRPQTQFDPVRMDIQLLSQVPLAKAAGTQYLQLDQQPELSHQHGIDPQGLLLTSQELPIEAQGFDLVMPLISS